MIIHVVQAGDTLGSIAGQYGVTPERIIIENELPNPDKLVVGQSIGIRVPDVVHTVASGDTLFSISEQYDVTPNRILQNNPQIAVNEYLTAGETLVITYEGDVVIDSLTFNGYAYPFIDREVLRRTLPFLTYLSIFTYGFSPAAVSYGIKDITSGSYSIIVYYLSNINHWFMMVYTQ
jgi:spore germination protein